MTVRDGALGRLSHDGGVLIDYCLVKEFPERSLPLRPGENTEEKPESGSSRERDCASAFILDFLPPEL